MMQLSCRKETMQLNMLFMLKKKKTFLDYFMFCCFVMITFQMLNLIELRLRRFEEREWEGEKEEKAGSKGLNHYLWIIFKDVFNFKDICSHSIPTTVCV